MKQLTRLGLALLLLLTACSSARAAVKYQAGDGGPPAGPFWWAFDSEPTDAFAIVGSVFSGTWKVRAEADAPSAPNALCQTGSGVDLARIRGQVADTLQAVSGRGMM